MIREDVIHHKAMLAGEFAVSTVQDVTLEEFVEIWHRLRLFCEDMVQRGMDQLEIKFTNAS